MSVEDTLIPVKKTTRRTLKVLCATHDMTYDELIQKLIEREQNGQHQ